MEFILLLPCGFEGYNLVLALSAQEHIFVNCIQIVWKQAHDWVTMVCLIVPQKEPWHVISWSKAPLLQSDLLTKAMGKNLCSEQEKKHVGNTKSQALTYI